MPDQQNFIQKKIYIQNWKSSILPLSSEWQTELERSNI